MFHVEHLVRFFAVFSADSFWLLSFRWYYLGRSLISLEDVFLMVFSSFAFFPSLIRWSSWGGVVSDDVELLAHGPKVCGGPVDKHSDRKAHTTHGKNNWEYIKQDFLLLSHWVSWGHVFHHKLALSQESGG